MPKRFCMTTSGQCNITIAKCNLAKSFCKQRQADVMLQLQIAESKKLFMPYRADFMLHRKISSGVSEILY